jgi:radical SAM protein with 4Fe4S-binding SPASM domain
MILDQQSINSMLFNIQNKYTIIDCPIFFSSLADASWKNNLFNRLKKARKDVYQDLERIVIVQDISDRYNYSDSAESPGEMLTFLHSTLLEIDITNFFVLIITPNPDIGSELATLKKTHPGDETIMQYQIVNGDYIKERIKQDTFCAIPWTELYVSTDGSVFPCCLVNKKYPVGDLKTDNFIKVFNGSQMNAIRKNMLTGHKSLECENCYIMEQNATKSKREQYNEVKHNQIEHIKKTANKDGSIDTIDITDFHLELNSVCNLMCRTCSGTSSTKLAVEEKKLLNFPNNFNKILNRTERRNIFKQISLYINKAKKINFTGGEPTLQKEQYEILDKLIEYGLNDTVSLQYNINCTTLALNEKSIIDYWNKFQKVHVQASLDGHGEQFEYIRHGAVWSEVERNFQTIKAECPHVDLKVNSVISFLSIESVIQLQRIWHERNILTASKFKMSLMLENSGYYDLQSLPLHHKKRISKKIDNHCQWLLEQNCISLKNDWLTIKNYMNLKDKTYLLQETKKDCLLRDSSRNVNFYNVFPHLSDVFEL